MSLLPLGTPAGAENVRTNEKEITMRITTSKYRYLVELTPREFGELVGEMKAGNCRLTAEVWDGTADAADDLGEGEWANAVEDDRRCPEPDCGERLDQIESGAGTSTPPSRGTSACR